MPNKNYIAGRRKEYKIMKQLRNIGYDIVIRSAGSHSPVDIVAISTKNKHMRFIQCKPKSMSDNAKEKLTNEQIALTDEYLCLFEVV
jgi:Holliday junction resolvase